MFKWNWWRNNNTACAILIYIERLQRLAKTDIILKIKYNVLVFNWRLLIYLKVSLVCNREVKRGSQVVTIPCPTESLGTGVTILHINILTLQPQSTIPLQGSSEKEAGHFFWLV